MSRVSGRGGGTSLPGKLLLRLKPDAIALLGRQLGARFHRDQRDQRQDDHGRAWSPGSCPRPG